MAPESPSYLVRRGHTGQAERVLLRLNRDPLYNSKGALARIRAVNAQEEAFIHTEQMGFKPCLCGTNRRRTEIAVVVYSTQQLVGLSLINYALKLLNESAISLEDGLIIVMAMCIACIVLSLASIFAMRAWSRRKMWLSGLAIEVICLIIIGALGTISEENAAAGWAISGLIILFAAVYNFTIGPLSFAIVAETPATRLKTATNCIARAVTLLLAIVFIWTTPLLLEDGQGGLNLGGRVAFIWAGTASLCLVWAYFRLPEMKDRSPEQVNTLFELKLSAREWSSIPGAPQRRN